MTYSAMKVIRKATSTASATHESAEKFSINPFSVGTIPPTRYLIKKMLAIKSAIFIISKIFVDVFMFLV